MDRACNGGRESAVSPDSGVVEGKLVTVAAAGGAADTAAVAKAIGFITDWDGC